MDLDGIEYIHYVKDRSFGHHSDTMFYMSPDQEELEKRTLERELDTIMTDKKVKRTLVFYFYKTMARIELFNLMEQIKERFGNCFVDNFNRDMVSGDLHAFAIEYHSIVHDWERIK